MPWVFCNIPYLLVIFFLEGGGGHFVTGLTKSCGVYIPCMFRSLNYIPGNDLTMNFLETIRMVVNLGGTYGIPPDDP